MLADLIHHHSILLNDHIRMEGYKSAIAANVKANDVVVDIGSGLGILSFLAIRAGAKRVYAIEADSITIRLAREIAKQHKMDKKITFIRGLSSHVDIGEKADVIISEIFGNLAINENILPAIIDARNRFLKSNGLLIPASFKLFVAPIACSRWLTHISSLHNIDGFDFSLSNHDYAIPIHSETIALENLLAPAQELVTIELYDQKKPFFSSSSTFTIIKEGILSGFAGWFDTSLAKNISFSTAPDQPPTHWKQAFLPFKEPLKVSKGSKITFHLKSDPDATAAGPENMISYWIE